MTNSTKTVSQRIETLPLDKVTAAEYQRTTNTKQVTRIVNSFNEAKLGIPVVSERGGRYYIIDGAHRVAALRRLGYWDSAFIVLSGMSYEDEAEYFRTQNENTRRLSLFTRFKAGLEAGDETCLEINGIVENNGFKVGTCSRSFNTITAIYALTTIYDTYGAAALDDTLWLIRGTWDGNPQAKSREMLVGVAEFVRRFGISNFTVRLGRFSFAAIWQEYLQSAQYQNRATAIRHAYDHVPRVG